MNREIVWTAQFKKDDKLAMKRHMDMDLLDHIIRALSRGETLPERNKDHSLTGDWVGHRECHIQPDWLLAYRMEEDVLVLTLARTGLANHQIPPYGKQNILYGGFVPPREGEPPGNWGDSGAFPGGRTLCASAAALHDSEKFAP